jgi:hypothetical protein
MIQKKIFVNEIRKTFSEIMDTGTDHIAISLENMINITLLLEELILMMIFV